MRVIPVLDLKSGVAVHAVGGDRAHYAPVVSRWHEGADPVALARRFQEELALTELYVADLDAIVGSGDNAEAIQRMIELGINTWVDVGARDAADVASWLDAGASVVAGLETVRGPEALGRIVSTEPDRILFSLDLRDGQPIVDTLPTWGTEDPATIARRAVEAGVRTLIHLDVARVGTGRGVGPGLEWLPGLGVAWGVAGGIRGSEDLELLAGLGASLALVGSALHDGRVGRAELDRLRSAFTPFNGRRTS
jgi:phosphoribosylformimino-5-aminoimidazole carboxamide ribotide isomerase